MYSNLIQFYYDYFMDEKNDGWRLIKSSVCISVLLGLYNSFTDKKEVPPIENLLIEQKKKYWDIACKYYQELPEQLKATKAAYVLSLICSNE